MYHFLKLSIGLDILGNIVLPIFFILSGFSLSVVYGASVEGKSYSLNIAEFYRNRFARIYPVYILTTFLPHCLVFTDYSFEFIKVPTFSFETMDAASWISSIFLNVLVVQSWPILLGIPYRYRAFLNMPAWFVSTLWFQYLIFPYTVQCYRRIPNEYRVVTIGLCCLLTMTTSISIWCLTHDWFAATFSVISPGFFMFSAGAVSGMWCAQRTMDERQYSAEEQAKSKQHWAVQSDTAVSILMFWVVGSVVAEALGYQYGAQLVVEVVGTPLMVWMVISLSMDGGTSRFASLCRWTPSVFLGKISMSLYLIHCIVLRYFCVLIQVLAPQLLPPEITTLTFLRSGFIPFWGIFVIVPLSLIFGTAIERFVERPCRRLLQAPKPQQHEQPLTDKLPAVNEEERVKQKRIENKTK